MMNYVDILREAVMASQLDLIIENLPVLASRDNGKRSQIIIPSVALNEELHYSVKSLYEAARKRRDWGGEGKPPTWHGIEIPALYFPPVSQKRGSSTNPSPSKPLFKIACGSIIKEFDKSVDSVELLKSEVWQWLEPLIKERWLDYRQAAEKSQANAELDTLLKTVKPIADLTVDDTVKVSMINPLLISKGYKQATELAHHLLEIASDKVEKNLSLLEKK